MSGLQFQVPGLRGQLPECWRLWKHWGNQEAPVRAPPLTREAVLALAYYMYEWGYQAASLLTVLGFYRFMRTSEILELTAGQVVFTKKKTACHLVLQNTKTSKRQGTMETISVQDAALTAWLRALVAGAPANQKLLEITPLQYRRLFEGALKAVGLPAKFKPYSLRRGGASHYFKETGSMSKTMETGRWSDVKTAKIYVNTALP